MFQLMNTYKGMSIVASLICLLLSYFAIQSSGRLPEIWPNRCLMAQKEWTQLQISKQMAEQADLSKQSNQNLKQAVPTENLQNQAQAQNQAHAQIYWQIDIDRLIYMPKLKYTDIHVQMKDGLLTQVELTSTDGLKWIFEQQKWDTKIFKTSLNELLGRQIIDDQWLLAQKIESAYEIEMQNLKSIDTFSCTAKESEIELLALYQAFQDKARGVEKKVKWDQILMKQSAFEQYRQKSFWYAPFKSGFDLTVSFFASLDHPYLAEDLLPIQSNQIDQAEPFSQAFTQLMKALQSSQIANESKKQLVSTFADQFQMKHHFK
jgi:hypothetical protein